MIEVDDFLPPALACIVGTFDLVVHGDAKRWAIMSRCEKYRYALVTEVNHEGQGASGFCGCNPSYATHEVDDNTHTKCCKFTRRDGFRFNWMVNAYAYRDRWPQNLKSVADPVGPANDAVLHFAAGHLARLIAAWGNNAAHLARGARVKRELRALGTPLWVMRTNKDGSPEHPLYLPDDTQPVVWE